MSSFTDDVRRRLGEDAAPSYGALVQGGQHARESAASTFRMGRDERILLYGLMVVCVVLAVANPLLVDGCSGQGGLVGAARTLLTDDKYHIRAQVAAWIADTNIQVVLITGGTGFYGRDNTPEAVAVLFDKTIDGFGEAFRAASIAEIGMSTLQSRALAGMANRTAVFCMPGSTGACQTAWEHVLKDQLDSRTRPCNFYPHLTRETIG